MPNPLARDKDRQLDVELQLAHLEWGRVPVAHQVSDQPRVVANALGALAIGHASSLDDGVVIPHVVHDPDNPWSSRGCSLNSRSSMLGTVGRRVGTGSASSRACSSAC